MTQVHTTRPSTNRAALVGRALLALLLITAIVVGVPALLLAIGAVPGQEPLSSWTRLGEALTSPDDGTLLLALLVVVAWASWAVLTAALALEMAGRMRGVPVPRLPTMSLPQGVARGLIGAVAAAFLTVQPATASPLAAPVVAASPAGPAVARGEPADRRPAPDPMPASATPIGGGMAHHPAETAAQRAAVAADEQVPPFAHTVRPGETLWSLAERYLGDGSRYTEIAELNYGRLQPDGGALNDSHWIMPGWHVLVPEEEDLGGEGASAGSPAVAATSDEGDAPEHVVEPGESLWQIAEDELGDGRKWPDIYAASTGLDQPDGDRLRDPDHLRPGWELALHVDRPPATPATDPVAPSAMPAVPQPATTPAATIPAATTPAATIPAATTPAATTPAAHSQTGPDAAPDAAVDVWDGLDELSPWTARTTGGVGALLAAGILATLGTRRRMQNLRRRPGMPLPRISADLADAERRLRTAADPLSVHTIDLVLRSLANHCARTGVALPALRAARLTPTRFEIYVEHAVQLPEPWFCPDEMPTGLVWALTPDEAPILADDELADIPAPYPALVTLGHDHEDAHFLVDLEHLGVLDLVGPTEVSRAVLAAIAVELATSTWADDVQVTVVGEFAGLEDGLKTGRLRYLPALGDALDELATRAQQDEEALIGAGAVDLQQARALGIEPGTWTTEVLLVAVPMTETQQVRLAELVGRRPRTAWAGVTLASGTGRWTLRLTTRDGEAELAPLGLSLRPQLMDDDIRSQVQHLVALADPDVPPTDRAVSVEENTPDEPCLLDLDDCRDQLAVEADDDAVVQAVSPSAGMLDPQVAPVVRVLGSVQIEGARGQVEPSKRARLSELIAFLALNPGVDHVQIDEAIWPGRRPEDNLNTRNTATSKARAWLGRTASQQDYLPRHAAATGYALSEEVRTDWALWQELVGDAVVTAATEDLDAALALVRGRPFEGVHPRRYAWADTLRQQMTAHIVDAAYELARRRLLSGRWQAAEAATVVGLMVEPAWEPLWRLRIMAAHEARNLSAVTEAVARMLVITDTVTGDLEPATLELLSALESRGEAVAALRSRVTG